MSEKPILKPSARASAKATGNGASPGTRSASAGETDESYEFLAPSQGTDELGRLAHYRVLKVLGRGGMGAVFMAEDTRLHRIVALKVMLPSIAKKAIARDRFMREAKATAAIEHDHIVTVYEVNQDRDVPYLTMQFLKGMSLDDWLKAGKSLNLPQIMRIGKEIAKALAAAHACQLIHRDIKPSNIWLDAANKGRVKILDFGLARPTNEETHLTQQGMILGTPAYMSPEQARGQDIDERCDLFSLGCVLYRLCAGKLPFTGKDTMSMLLAITSEEPPALQELNHDLPPAFAALIHRLLAKKPEGRPPSAKSVVQAIQDIERDWIANTATTAARPAANTASLQTARDRTIALNSNVAIDPILEASAITELELQVTPPPASPPRNRSWLLAGLGGAFIAILLTMCCIGTVFVANHGVVEIVAEDEAAKAWLQETGLVLWDHNQGAHTLKGTGLHPLPSGGYHVNRTDLPEGMQVDPEQFSLHRAEQRPIKVRLTPKRSPPLLVSLLPGQAKKIQQDWAAYLHREVEETNTTGGKLILIPPGEFVMGTSKEQIKSLLADVFKRLEKKGSGDPFWNRLQHEAPPHKVRITRPFYLGSTEVTWEQFSAFRPKSEPKAGSAKHAPVNNITWKDAEEYCGWLSTKESKVYRLPTEAEWEYACRAGTTTLWHFGDDAQEARARAHMWYSAPGKSAVNPSAPSAVGKKNANELGLHDMHGNVAEMCSDSWAPFFYERSVKEGIIDDPRGPDGNPTANRVVRGGAFSDPPLATRAAYRLGLDPSIGHAHVGFRIVCEVPLPE